MLRLPNWVKDDLSITKYTVIDETETAYLLLINDEYTRWIPKNLPSAKPRNKYALHEVYRKGEVDKVDNIANAFVAIPSVTRLLQLRYGFSDIESVAFYKSLSEREVVEMTVKYETDISSWKDENETFENIVKQRFIVDSKGYPMLKKETKYYFSKDFENLHDVVEILGDDKFLKINEKGKVKNFEARPFLRRELTMTNKDYATNRVLCDQDYKEFVYSSYFGCSPLCIEFQGVKGTREFWDGVIFPRGTALHPYCKHLLSPFIPGLSREDVVGDEVRSEPSKNDEKYQKSQLMRKNERYIRRLLYKIQELESVGLDTKTLKMSLSNAYKTLEYDEYRLQTEKHEFTKEKRVNSDN